MATSKHQHKNNKQDLPEMAASDKAGSSTSTVTASGSNAALSDNGASTSSLAATTTATPSIAAAANAAATNAAINAPTAEDDENFDFSNLIAANILTEKRKSPFTPASKEETAKVSDKARLMDNGTLMQAGHTVVQGIENRDPSKATFEHSTKVTHKISDAERDVVAQIYALNKKKKDKSAAKAKAKNQPATNITSATVANSSSAAAVSTQSIATTPTVAANQQSIATGHTTIIGAADSSANSSGAVNALNRLRSTLNADQQAYASASQIQQQTLATPVTAETTAPVVATAASTPTAATTPRASRLPSNSSTTGSTLNRAEPSFASPASNTTAPYAQNFSGNEIGSAIDSEVISGAGLGNALDDRSLSRNGLNHGNRAAGTVNTVNAVNAAMSESAATVALAPHAAAAPAPRENRSSSSADFAGYPAMDPNDLPPHARRAARQESRPTVNSFQTFGDDDDDLPAINLNRTSRSLPAAEDMPHYVVGNNRALQDSSSDSPLSMAAHATSASNTAAASATTAANDAANAAATAASAATTASATDAPLYPGVYAAPRNQQGMASPNLVIPPEPSPVIPDATNFDRTAHPEIAQSTMAAAAARAVPNTAPAPTPDQTRMVLRNIPQTASDIDDDDLIYPGVFATKLKRQQKRILQEQEARNSNNTDLAANGTNANYARGIDGGDVELNNNLGMGMGDGLLTQVKISVDEAIDDQGPQYQIGPRKKVLPPSDNDEPVYAIGVNLTNAEVEAKIQAERQWLNEANGIPNTPAAAVNAVNAVNAGEDTGLNEQDLTDNGLNLNEDDFNGSLDPAAAAAANADYAQVYGSYAADINDEQAYNAAVNGNQREALGTRATISNSGNVRNAPLDASAQIPDLGASTDDFSPAPQELFTSSFSGATRDESATPNDGSRGNNKLNTLNRDNANNTGAAANTAYARNGTPNAAVAVQQKERKLNQAKAKAKRQQASEEQAQYNLTDLPAKERVGLGMMLFLYLRQLIASFFSYTTLPSFMPRLAMHLGPSYPSSMAIPFFFVGLLSGLVGYAIKTSLLGLQHAGMIAFMIYTLLIGLPAYRGIYRICTVILRKRHDMILMIASVTIPLMIMAWMFNSILQSASGIQEASLLLGIASMLSAATASTMMWNFPQDPLDSCGRMSNFGLLFVLLLCLLLSFGLLNQIVGISVLGVSFVMRLIFGYSIAKNQGTAQRPYIYALQQITLFAILLDLILLKGQGFPVLNSDNAMMLQNLVEGTITLP